MMETIGIGALMAGRQAAQATQQLQKGISPGVRASGPFAKQISQANKAQQEANKRATLVGTSVASRALPMAGYAANSKGMGSKFGM